MQPDKDMPLDIIVSFPHSVLSAGVWAETPENNKRGRIKTIMVKISFVRDKDLQVQDEQGRCQDFQVQVGHIKDRDLLLPAGFSSISLFS